MPIRFRLTAWYASLLAVIVASLGVFLVVQLRADLEGVIDREVRDRATSVTRLFEEEVVDERSADGVARDFAALCASAAPGAGTLAELLGPSGELLSSCREGGSARTEVPPGARAGAIAGRSRLITVEATSGSERWRAMVAPLVGAHVLVVAESLDGVDDAVQRLLVLLLLTGPAALAATAAGGWWLARKALLPVERMTARAGDRHRSPGPANPGAGLRGRDRAARRHLERDARPTRAGRRGQAPAGGRRLTPAAHTARGHAHRARRDAPGADPARGGPRSARERA